MGLAVERLPLTLRRKKLYISGRSNDNDNLLEIDYGGSHIVALQRSSERRKTKQGEERCQPFPLLTLKNRTAILRFLFNKKPRISSEFRGNYEIIAKNYSDLKSCTFFSSSDISTVLLLALTVVSETQII